MANIMITEMCNLRCPYCFADEFVNVEKKHMTLENFKKAVDFAMTNPDERVGIIGGEPTLHPNFKEIMETLIYDDRVKHVVLFTNGICLDKYYKLLMNPKISMLVNCNSPEDIGEERFKKMVQNLDILFNEYYIGDKITLGINMYKPGFDYDYMIDLLVKYNKHHVRTSIVVPNTDEKANNMKDYFLEMKPSVFEFFKELKKRGIMPTYDCNLMPTCLLTNAEMEWLKTFWELEPKAKARCNLIDGSMCTPVIDILPDLRAVRCFGLSEEWKAPIENFANVNELRDYFYNIFDVFAFTVDTDPQCHMCTLRQKRQCTGGCLAFKKNKIKQARDFCAGLTNIS